MPISWEWLERFEDVAPSKHGSVRLEPQTDSGRINFLSSSEIRGLDVDTLKSNALADLQRNAFQY